MLRVTPPDLTTGQLGHGPPQGCARTPGARTHVPPSREMPSTLSPVPTGGAGPKRPISHGPLQARSAGHSSPLGGPVQRRGVQHHPGHARTAPAALPSMQGVGWLSGVCRALGLATRGASAHGARYLGTSSPGSFSSDRAREAPVRVRVCGWGRWTEMSGGVRRGELCLPRSLWAQQLGQVFQEGGRLPAPLARDDTELPSQKKILYFLSNLRTKRSPRTEPLHGQRGAAQRESAQETASSSRVRARGGSAEIRQHPDTWILCLISTALLTWHS